MRQEEWWRVLLDMKAWVRESIWVGCGEEQLGSACCPPLEEPWSSSSELSAAGDLLNVGGLSQSTLG